jgi:hypothetical protein
MFGNFVLLTLFLALLIDAFRRQHEKETKRARALTISKMENEGCYLSSFFEFTAVLGKLEAPSWAEYVLKKWRDRARVAPAPQG